MLALSFNDFDVNHVLMYYQMTTQGHTNILNEGYCDTIFFIIRYMMDDFYHRMKRTIYR